MQMPPALTGFGSDSDEEMEASSSSAGPNLTLAKPGGAPPMLAGFGDSDDEDDVDGPPANLSSSAPKLDMKLPGSGAPMDKNAFLLSQSGAFKVSDFQIRAEGGLTTVGEDESSSPNAHAHPSELGFAEAAAALDVNSLAELEMLEELGSGASGVVSKARHLSSGTFVAVKCVTILEKAKRDQVVSELRIMKKHNALGARWLVHMHDAFYEVLL